MRVVVLRPEGQTGPLPGILWIHGGGYAMGFPEMVYASCGHLAARRFGAVVLSPDYRRAWQAPYPAALIDCYRTLLYMKAHAAELGIRDDQIFVGGESAGGGLCAALCMLAHDLGTVQIAAQMPLYPMLDSLDTASSAHNHLDPTWGTWRNHAAWGLYLRRPKGERDAVNCYASPSRRRDYRGLPPCYSFVCRDEPFHDETVAFMERLNAAGVEAKLDVWPGNYHAFDMLLVTPKARAARQAFAHWYDYARQNYFAPQR